MVETLGDSYSFESLIEERLLLAVRSLESYLEAKDGKRGILLPVVVMNIPRPHFAELACIADRQSAVAVRPRDCIAVAWFEACLAVVIALERGPYHQASFLVLLLRLRRFDFREPVRQHSSRPKMVSKLHATDSSLIMLT